MFEDMTPPLTQGYKKRGSTVADVLVRKDKRCLRTDDSQAQSHMFSSTVWQTFEFWV